MTNKEKSKAPHVNRRVGTQIRFKIYRPGHLYPFFALVLKVYCPLQVVPPNDVLGTSLRLPVSKDSGP
jgi:hypothetical protein